MELRIGSPRVEWLVGGGYITIILKEKSCRISKIPEPMMAEEENPYWKYWIDIKNLMTEFTGQVLYISKEV